MFVAAAYAPPMLELTVGAFALLLTWSAIFRHGPAGPHEPRLVQDHLLIIGNVVAHQAVVAAGKFHYLSGHRSSGPDEMQRSGHANEFQTGYVRQELSGNGIDEYKPH